MSTPPIPQSKKKRNQDGRLTRRPRPWWESPRALGGGALAVVLVIIVIVALVGRSSGSAGPDTSAATPLPAAVLDAITKPQASLFETVGRGGQPGHLTRLSGTTTRTDSDGKPLVIYVGAEYCPFCASERWSLAMALARFGSFTNLHESSSSGTDVFPSTSTLTFHGSTFSSPSLAFTPVEMENSQGQPLESPSAQVAGVFAAFDKPPYTGTAQGFPFLDIAGRFVLSQTSYSPQVLQGKSWEAIAAALATPSDPITQAIVGNANFMTAAICIAIGGQASPVCNSPAITPIAQTLNAETPAV